MDENLWNHTSLQFVWTSGGRLFIENLGCCSWTFDPNSGRPFVRNPCRPFVRTSDRPFVQTYVGFHVSFWWNKYDYCAESLKAENPSPAWLTWVTLCLFTWSPVLEVLASRNFGLCFRDFECRQWEHDDAENWTYQNGPENIRKVIMSESKEILRTWLAKSTQIIVDRWVVGNYKIVDQLFEAH